MGDSRNGRAGGWEVSRGTTCGALLLSACLTNHLVFSDLGTILCVLQVGLPGKEIRRDPGSIPVQAWGEGTVRPSLDLANAPPQPCQDAVCWKEQKTATLLAPMIK